jgi:hypothetical protein
MYAGVVEESTVPRQKNKLKRAVGPATTLYHRPMMRRISNFLSIYLIKTLAVVPRSGGSGKSTATAVDQGLRFIQPV